MPFVLLLLLVLIIALAISCIVKVPQGSAYVIERLGKMHAIWEAGLHFKVPVIDDVRRKVLLKEQTLDYPPQPVITKDNVSMSVDAVIYFRVFDPKMYTYGVENPIMAMELQAATCLRSIIGELTLDECLTSREIVNEKMRQILDDATDPWGIKVSGAFVKSLQLPESVQEAMEKQITAERNKRAEILEAQGHKEADILKAQGHKEALILDAEADKQKRILEAEAKKQALINEAEGQAEAIRRVHEAQAEGLRALKEAGADEAVLRLKSYETMEKVADGQSTKIIVPSDLANLTSLAVLAGSAVKDGLTADSIKHAEVPEQTDVHKEPEFLKR